MQTHINKYSEFLIDIILLVVILCVHMNKPTIIVKCNW